MQIHEVTRTHPNKSPKRVGRGGTRGKTSGRGMKGQKARAGRKIRPEIRDEIKKIPKLRGHGKNRSKSYNSGNVSFEVVNVRDLEKVFSAGNTVSPKILLEKGMVRRRGGKLPGVKVLGAGDISKALKIEDCVVSVSAREKIEKAGGSIIVEQPEKK